MGLSIVAPQPLLSLLSHFLTGFMTCTPPKSYHLPPRPQTENKLKLRSLKDINFPYLVPLLLRNLCKYSCFF